LFLIIESPYLYHFSPLYCHLSINTPFLLYDRLAKNATKKKAPAGAGGGSKAKKPKPAVAEKAAV